MMTNEVKEPILIKQLSSHFLFMLSKEMFPNLQFLIEKQQIMKKLFKYWPGRKLFDSSKLQGAS